jgi:hypothetical protein
MTSNSRRAGVLLAMVLVAAGASRGEDKVDQSEAWQKIAPYFSPPPQYADQLGDYRSPLLFDDGTPVKTADDWKRRRREILDYWHNVIGPWPPLIERPKVEFLETKAREDFTQHKVRVEVAPNQTVDG